MRIQFCEVRMKKKILLITRDFTPISNGTISCLENLIPVLSAAFDLTVVTNKSSLFQPTTHRENGFSVIRYASFDQMLTSFAKKMSLLFSKTPGLRQVKILLSRGKQQRGSSQKPTLGDPQWVMRFSEFVASIMIKNPAEAIIAVGAPFEDMRVAVNLKKQFPQCQLILLQFDLFTHNPETMAATLSDPLMFQARLAEEKDWLSIADAVLVVNEMIDTMFSSELSQFKEKIIPFNLPGFLRQSESKDKYVSSGPWIDFIYTGAFYPEIRNPQRTLEILYRLSQSNGKIRIHLFSRGCDEIVERYLKKMPDQLIYHGYQSKSKVMAAVQSSAFLINIGNTTSNQVPSKILEYISTGKPIINFYSVDHDLCNEYLMSYPYCLLLNVNDNPEILAQQLSEFVSLNTGKQASFDHLMSLYEAYTPLTLGHKIIDIIMHKQDVLSVLRSKKPNHQREFGGSQDE